MSMSTLTPRFYNIKGTISASTKFTAMTVVRPNGEELDGDWISIRNCGKLCLHIIVSNQSSFGGKLSAFVSGIDPSEVNSVTINGVRYNGGTSDVTLSVDGEYILDIVATAASFVNPYIEVSAGTAEIKIIVSGKSI